MSAATSSPPDQGWLYELLRWAGVDQTTAAHWQQVVVKPVAVIGIFLLAVIFGWLGSRVIRRGIGAAARKAVARTDSPRAEARAATITALLANIWRGVVFTIALFVILGTIGLNLTPLLAGATVIGATLGFGAQSMVRDLLSGFLLTVEGQYDIGDTVMVGDTTGTVEDLTLRVTRLRSADGTVWFVPNGEIRKLANSSRGWAQAVMDVQVPLTADVDEVLDAVTRAATDVRADARYARFFLEAPRVWGVVSSDATTLTSRVSVRTPTEQRDLVARALREGSLRSLHAAGLLSPEQPASRGGDPRAGPEPS